jgi:prepilin-type N-terminal cleavage/methylation domain-containing protein
MKKLLPGKITSAFTLIELLVVIAILGILSTLAIGNFRSSQLRSRDAQRKSDLRQISTALEVFYNDHGQYPAGNASGQIVGCPAPTSCEWGVGEFKDSKTVFIKVVQSDPTGIVDYCYKTLDSKSKFQLFAKLENPKDQDCIGGNCAASTSCGGVNEFNFSIMSTNAKLGEGTPDL